MSTEPSKVIAEHDYEAQDENQLSFKEGDIIIVKEEDSSGWWLGILQTTGAEGYFPQTYTKPYNGDLSPLAVTSNASPSEGRLLQNIQVKSESEISVSKNGNQVNPSSENYYSAEVLNLKFNPNSKTRFGIAAHYMSFASCIATMVFAISAWGWANGSKALNQGSKGLMIFDGLYCFFLSIIMTIWEIRYGAGRKISKRPWRSITYFAIGILPLFTLVTALAGAMWIITSIYDSLAWYYEEEYEAEAKGEFSEFKTNLTKYTTASYYITKTTNWLTEARQQSKTRKYLFVFVFLVFNFAYTLSIAVYYQSVVKGLNDGGKNSTSFAGLSGTALNSLYVKNGNVVATNWLPFAKLFGNLLDINCAFILFPVCRSFIRYLYNISTDQRSTARACNFILSFMPLDKAIQWHKLMAFLIVIGAVFHTWGHFMQYAQVPATYDYLFGPSVWVTGVTIVISMQLLYSTSFVAVRHGKFELFWYTHHIFIIFIITLLFHGKGGIGPNYWKWLLVPGFLYILERSLREIRSRQPVGVISVTHMNNVNAKVFCLELEKTGPIREHQEGQYVFIKAPIISSFQWHPFTISSPPDQSTLTLHIRNMGPGTWTDRLQTFFQVLSPNKAYCELYHREGIHIVPQSIGPDGNSLICIDGPMAAPTQHLGEYCTAVIVGAGIGVTPVRATLQSIVYYRFKRGIGRSYPDHAYCVWVVNYEQLDAYRFMVRTLKEAEDELYDMRKKNPQQMKDKLLQIHIFITSVPKNPQFDESEIETNNDKDKDLAIWGPHYNDINKTQTIAQEKAPFTETDIWRVLKQPFQQATQIGDIIVHNGRPNWPEFFGPVQQQHKGDRIGVMFCGPEIIAQDLKKNCGDFTDFSSNTIFMLHKENF